MLHDRYDLDIEHAIRLLPFDGRDRDETGAEMFWDLAGKIAGEINTFSQEEKQELLYNALHKVREATTAELLEYAKTLPNYSAEEMEPINDFVALIEERP